MSFQGLISRQIVLFLFSSFDIWFKVHISTVQPAFNFESGNYDNLYHIPKYGHVYQAFTQCIISCDCGVSFKLTSPDLSHDLEHNSI